ncbi:hypothetical protein B0H13DRAFT_2317384 [Mycena leptocephala]|nr:hypothetical protein B0H13DRAFT_2317384 [Mycena leptocephala]
MSVNIVLPPLKTWAEQHLSSIIKATTKPAFDSAFEAFLSKQAKITVNGKSVSRDDYQKQLEGEGFGEAGAAVHFTGAVEVPSESNDIQSGLVDLFYTAVIDEIRDAPVERQITTAFNSFLTPPHLPQGVHGFFDGRRVSVLNQIIAVRED